MALTEMDAIPDVFRDLSVTPQHGQQYAALTWTLTPGWDAATFTVQKSPDGINGWATAGKVVGQRWFTDTQLLSGDRFNESFYRVFARLPDDRKAWSPVVGTFGKLSRKEFGVASKIIELEARQLRTRSRAILLKRNPAATDCPACVDTTTGQRLTTSFCPACHGTGKTNAYFPGLETRVWFLDAPSRAKVMREDGAGTVDEHLAKARMLAIPVLDKDDFLAEPERDRRWLVETVVLSQFNGKVAVTCDLSLRLLARSDIRYQLPL